jgi:hypothetical protein
MILEKIHPQFRDTSVSTLLRTDTDQIYQFETSPKDSNEFASNETIQNIQPKPLQQSVTKKTSKLDDSYKKILSYKKELSKQDLVLRDDLTIQAQILKTYEPDTVLAKTTEVPPKDTSPVIAQDTVHSFIEVDPIARIKEASNNMQNSRFWQSNDWMIGVLLLSLIALAWIRMGYRKLLLENQKAVFSLRETARLFHEQNSLAKRVSSVLNIIFFINLAMFAYQILWFTNTHWKGYSGVYLYLILLLAIIIVYLSRVIAYRFLGYIFHYTIQSKEIIHSGFVVNRINAIVLMPVIASIPFLPDLYAEWFIYLGAGLFGLLYLIQIIRNLRLFLINNSSLLYSILYLCALEIVPVAVLMKYISSIL